MSDHRLRSYESHARHYRDHATGGPAAHHARTWLRRDTVDAWYHRRLYTRLLPLLRAHPAAAWLTVGDGRYGSDARYITRHGGRAVASDIAVTLLAEAAREGLIASWSVQNAEALTFADESFDLVCCKESFHHFPRPMLALYEMLRVARTAVVLIEPNDRLAVATGLHLCVIRAGRRVRRSSPAGHWEPSGNYVYTLSARELRKAALALDLPALATARFNSCYLAGIEYARARPRDRLFARLKRRLALYDLLTRLGLMAPNTLAAVLFKTPPSPGAARELAAAGFHLERLPRNPYAAR